MAVFPSAKSPVLPTQGKVLLLSPGGFQFFPITLLGHFVLFEIEQQTGPEIAVLKMA